MYRRITILIAVIIFSFSIFSGCGKQSEQELFTIAEEAQKDGKPVEALKAYRKVAKEYPGGENTPKAMFMIGFVYAEQIYDTTRAIDAFNEFLEKYPDNELSPSAEFMVLALKGEASDPVTAE